MAWATRALTNHATMATLNENRDGRPARSIGSERKRPADPLAGKSEPILKPRRWVLWSGTSKGKKACHHFFDKLKATTSRSPSSIAATMRCFAMIERSYLTPRQAAPLAGVTVQTTTRWCRSTPGFARRVGGRWRIDAATLDRLLSGEAPPPHAGAQVSPIAAAALPQ